MKKKVIMAKGTIYGRLTVVEEVGNDKHGKRLWKFLCECGTYTTVIGTAVRLGRTQSCGCLAREVIKEQGQLSRTLPDIIAGQTYGKLTAIKYVGKSKDRNAIWLFQCECGNTKEIQASSVAGKKATRSCGCLLKGIPSVHKNPLAYRRWHNTYSDGCPFEVFMLLCQEPCHYCGVPPSNVAKGTWQREKLTFTYNGLDRIDSSLDHSPGNLVPCCRACNYAKGDMTYDEFRVLIRRVFDYWASKSKEE